MGSRPGSFGDENWFDRPRDGSGELAERELAFDSSDERLPWLESEDESDEPPVYDTSRLIGLGLIMLVALVVLVGGVWFFANRGAVSGPAPDGSLIAAPQSPYKERPASPGGKTFAGTGDTSYAVGEGREVEGKLAPTSPIPPIASPTPAKEVTPAPKVTATPAPTVDAVLPTGTAVQVGAYSSRADAQAGWQRLTGQTDALSGVSHRIIAGRADIGTVYRLQAVGGDRAGARALCARLKGAGIACQVK